MMQKIECGEGGKNTDKCGQSNQTRIMLVGNAVIDSQHDDLHLLSFWKCNVLDVIGCP
jgi:hypothetical protein